MLDSGLDPQDFVALKHGETKVIGGENVGEDSKTEILNQGKAEVIPPLCED